MAEIIQVYVALAVFGGLLLIFSIPLIGALITAITSRSFKSFLKFLFSSYATWFTCVLPVYLYILFTKDKKQLCININAKTASSSPCSGWEQFFYVDLVNWLVYAWIASAFFICYFFFKKYGKRVNK